MKHPTQSDTMGFGGPKREMIFFSKNAVTTPADAFFIAAAIVQPVKWSTAIRKIFFLTLDLGNVPVKSIE